MVRKIVIALVGLGVLASAVGVALVMGYRVTKDDTQIGAYVERVSNKVDQLVVKAVGTPTVAPATYPSHLLTLRSEVVRVDFERGGSTGVHNAAHPMNYNGGGVTSFGNDVLLLPFDGYIYAASSANDIRRTNVRAPDIGRDAFAALETDPAYADYDIAVARLRYNDIAFVETADARRLVASYIEFDGEEVCYRNVLAALEFGPDVTSIDQVEAGPDDWTILHRTEPCLPLKRQHLALEGHMAGGSLAFAAPSTLYWTSGDFHLDGMRADPPAIAQIPEAEYGKVLAYDFTTNETRIVSTGHRNPQGIVVTPEGLVFEVEHGPRGGDELNLIVEGGNYGWPLESFGTTYAQTSIPNSLSFARHDRFTPPKLSWVPSVATSGVTYVNGFNPYWDGDLLVGSLIAESLFRVRLVGDVPVYTEAIRIGARIRDVHQHTDGRIVLWTDSQTLIFLSGENPGDLEHSVESFAREKHLSSANQEKVASMVLTCAECHSFQEGDHEKSPSLAKVYGAEIASTSYANYSDALKQKQGTWDHETLAAFLAAPQDFAPGTGMPAVNIEDRNTLNLLVDFLEAYAIQY